MKALLLALALTGSTLWEESTETYAGIVCPTRSDVERVAGIYHSYLFSSRLERTRCRFVAFEGRKTGESDAFSIGGTLYNFWVIDYEGHEVYLLHEIGPGYET